MTDAAPFRVVVADPCWRFDDNLPGKGRGASKHYATLPARDIEALRLPPVAEDALLFLWRVSSMQEEALCVCRAWGFTPKSEIVWVKTTRHGDVLRGMGRYVRNAHETCLIAARGRGASIVRDHSIASVFMAPRGRHSEKPEEFYRIVEALSEGPYVELFARASRPGWTTIGDEIGSRLVLPLEGAP